MPDEPAWVGENGDEMPSKLKELLHVPRKVARVDRSKQDVLVVAPKAALR